MNKAILDTSAANFVPAWKRVDELADLVEIFDPSVQVCSWQRDIDPAIGNYLAGLQQTPLQSIETLATTDSPGLASLPADDARSALIEDLSHLQEIISELLGCTAVGMRFARVGHAMCPGWHVDQTGIRLVCTYHGPGTQWLENQNTDRSNLRKNKLESEPFIEAAVGEVVLLKGSLWQENEGFGAVHRSPEITSNNSLRTLVTLDPLWHEG